MNLGFSIGSISSSVSSTGAKTLTE